jgi:hypothetical protein
MKKEMKHRYQVAVMLLIAVLAAFPSETFAQDAAVLKLATARTPEKNKGDFNANNTKIWSNILAQCSVAAVNEACANAAIFAASAECEDSAKFFKKGTTGWQTITLLLTLASASFTAVGASSTIASAKIFSTLGGTTGLGAVGTTINANSAGDQAGLASVNSTIGKLQTFALGTGTPPAPPAAVVIFQQARLYGAQCAAAANGSPANNSSSTPSKP